jgi:hypothetical protein
MLLDVSHEEALRLISEYEQRAVPILGLEWFIRRGDTVTPVGVADFSGDGPDTTWDEARRLLADGIPDGANTVEVVTSDEPKLDEQS